MLHYVAQIVLVLELLLGEAHGENLLQSLHEVLRESRSEGTTNGTSITTGIGVMERERVCVCT